MSTVAEIVSDPAFSQFSSNAQVDILRRLKGDEVANAWHEHQSSRGSQLGEGAPEKEPSLLNKIGAGAKHLFVRTPEEKEGLASGAATQSVPLGQLAAGGAALFGGGPALEAALPAVGGALATGARALATPQAGALIGLVHGGVKGGLSGALREGAQGALLGGVGHIGKARRIIAALGAAAPAAKATVPVAAAVPAAEGLVEALVAGRTSLGKMSLEAAEAVAKRVLGAKAALPAAEAALPAVESALPTVKSALPLAQRPGFKELEALFGRKVEEGTAEAAEKAAEFLKSMGHGVTAP